MDHEFMGMTKLYIYGGRLNNCLINMASRINHNLISQGNLFHKIPFPNTTFIKLSSRIIFCTTHASQALRKLWREEEQLRNLLLAKTDCMHVGTNRVAFHTTSMKLKRCGKTILHQALCQTRGNY